METCYFRTTDLNVMNLLNIHYKIKKLNKYAW